MLQQETDLIAARSLLDETWYLDVDGELRFERLVTRHVESRKTPEEARAWAAGSDESNAELIRSGRHRADLILTGGPPAS